jgi:VIT1/CCC1 family predicted Fe2+/Mn2+ transporter
VLDPGERVQEIVFGVLMALTFTGSFSVATAGSEAIATMLTAALGCNLAWGLSDGVTYLVSRAVERQRHVALLHRIQATGDPTEAHRLIAEELPESLGADAGADALEALRQRLLAIPAPGAGLGFRDVAGAVGVFALVVLATFPVVVPFLVFKETGLALRVSNGLALATLFAGGFFLGRYAGGSPWRYGLAITGIGVVMVAAIIALGG